MIEAVLDANTLASGSVASVGTIALLINAFFSGRFRAFLSPPILRELERALAKPYFASRLAPESVADYLAMVRSAATVVEIMTPVRGVASHPDDDLVLATALTANVPYLVTGDIQLQRIGSYQGITILSPRAFVSVLEEAEASYGSACNEPGDGGAARPWPRA